MSSSYTVPATEALTLADAAQFLRVDAALLIDLAATGKVPARQIGGEWRFSRTALTVWLVGDRAEFAKLIPETFAKGQSTLANSTPRVALSPADSARLAARGMQPATSPDQGDGAIGEAPKGRTASEVFLRDQRVLLAPNELTLDFGLFYARSDTLTLLGAGDGPVLGTVESDTFGGVLTSRYSLGYDTELFASISYSDQRVALLSDGLPPSTASRGDVGDIALGVRRTVLHEGAGIPDVIVTLEGRIPTGSSPYSVGGGVTLVKSFDPAVLFGTLAYRRTFDRGSADNLRGAARDRFDASIGYAFALNDTLTLNSALNGIFLRGTDEDAVSNDETYNLLFGLTARLSRRLFLQPSIAYRLNGPGNGVVFGLNIPYTFGL